MIHLTIQQLSASLDGALTGPSLDLVVRHLALCTECRERQARLVRTDDALRRLLAQQTTDAFLDDLSMRAESWIAAIAQGLPEPGARPHAATPPPATPMPSYTPPPPMPEPTPSPSVVHQAGWGVIGMKPSVPAQAPVSDPDETRRLLEAMERAERGTAEPTPTVTNTPPTAAPNDLPTWLQEQARRAAESHLPQGPGLAQASAPPTSPFPREASVPAWPLPQPQVEAPRPWFVPASVPTPAMVVPQEHAAYAPPSLQSSASVPGVMPALTTPSQPTMAAQAFPAMAPSMAIPQPPAPEPIAAQAAHTLPGTNSDRYLSFEQHRELTRDKNRGLRLAMTIGLTLVAGAALVFLSLQLAPTAVRSRLGERVREMIERRLASTAPVTSIEPATTTNTEMDPTNVVPVAAPSVDALVPVTPNEPTSTPVVPAHATPNTPAVVPSVTPTTNTTSHAKAVVTTTDDSHWLQTCGVVVDGKGLPVAGAQITVTEIALSLRTDAQGRFCIAAPAGSQHLLIDAPGFTQVRQSVRFAEGSPELRLQLTRNR